MTEAQYLAGRLLLAMPGIQAGSPLKSLTVRHTRSIGALITVLTKAVGMSVPCFLGPFGRSARNRCRSACRRDRAAQA